jgi:hypothetical protein
MCLVLHPDGDKAAADDLGNSEWFEKGNDLVDAAWFGGCLKGDAFGFEVNDVAMHYLGDFENAAARLDSGIDLEEGEFSLDGVVSAEIFDFDYVDEFVELPHALAQVAVVALDDHGDSGKTLLLAVAGIHAAEREHSSSEETRESVEGS